MWKVCGWHVNSDTQEVRYLMASDFMLLNAHNISESGLPTTLMVDSTHRLISQGHAVFIVGCTDLSHAFHQICYGVTSSKTQSYHEIMLRDVKSAIEVAVNRRLAEDKDQ